ncbi:unnamed protein product [Phytomonas sp. EM1]|nr:unnamed protein product [Phytomonas sp. EM1]|eukprot:CCW65239.1 unnamed protein product [Phytomonas sp. isolate EM1]
MKPHKKKKVEPQAKEAELFLPTGTDADNADRSHTLPESLLRVEVAFCPRPSLTSPTFVDHETSNTTINESPEHFSRFTPRDLGNLLLWTVPTAIPLIEAPREFFIRNKSRLRNVVMIYVNGWSYDMMMATGVGLPRVSSQEIQSGMLSSHDNGDLEESITQVKKSEPPSLLRWNQRICHSMLKPIRTGVCWARMNQSHGNLGGVHYAPLVVPSIKNEFESDLFWRNDAPRVPKSSFRTQPLPEKDHSPVSEPCKGESKLMVVDHISCASSHDIDRDQEEIANIGRFSRSEKLVGGVGSAFKRAQAFASGQSPSSVPPSITPASSISCLGGDSAISRDDKECSPSTKGTHEEDPSAAQNVDPKVLPTLWDRREHLLKFALHFPEHQIELRELGFLLEKPGAQIHVDPKDCSASGDGSKACNNAQEDTNWDLFSTSDDEDEYRQDCAWKELRYSERPPRVFALDCEMVMTEGRESSLARATLVDARSAKVVFDMLVKPRTEIIDYLTRFSGINEETLRDVTNTLVDCQAALKMHIRSSDFIVGHSLENDFKACQMIPNCYLLDTAWLFPHPSGLPYKNSLRFLAMRYLGKRIQQGSHDSAMDAQISLELVQLKLERGPMFGIRQRVNVLDLMCGGCPNSNEAQVSRKAERSRQDIPIHIRLFDDPQVLSNILPKKSASTGAALIDAIPVRHDEDAVRKVVRALHSRNHIVSHTRIASDDDSYSFMWVQLRETAVNVLAQPSSGSVTAIFDEAEQLRRVELVNQRILRVIGACPDETLVVVVAADCRGEAGGNHFSRAQGACFGFIKDHTAVGPPASALTLEPNSNSVHPSNECETGQADNAEHIVKNQLVTAKPESVSPSVSAMPPACQQQ